MSVGASEEIRRSVVVPVGPERAWERFVDRIGSWFPLATHSIGGDEAVTAVVDRGRIYERHSDGSEHDWGRILVWDPPWRLAFTWEVGPSRMCGDEVEVRFRPEGEGTRVELEHRGWPESSAEMRAGYDSGWVLILERYEQEAAPREEER